MPATPPRSSPPGPGKEPRPTLRDLSRGNVGALAVISLLNDWASEMIYPLLPMFLTAVLGAGPAFLGLIEGVADATASLMKLVGGWLSDRSGRRKPLVAWGYGVAVFARPLVAIVTAPWQVLLVRFADRVGKGVRSAPRDALLAESVEEGRRGAAFGIHRGADHFGSVMGPITATLVLWALPGRLRLLFALALIPGVISLFVLWRHVREPGGAPGDTDGPAGSTEAARAATTGPAADATEAAPPEEALDTVSPSTPIEPTRLGRPFAAYVAVVVLFTLGNASDAFLLLRAGDLGVAPALIPMLWAALHVSKTAWSVPGGALADRFSAVPVIASGWLVYAGVYAGFAYATAEWHVWALFAVYGLYFGLTESPEKKLVAAFAPAHARGRAFGVFHAAVGFAALPASVLFGWVWQVWGATAAFLLGAAFALAAAVTLPLAVSPSTAPGRGGP